MTEAQMIEQNQSATSSTPAWQKSVIKMVRAIPEATLCSVLTSDTQRKIIVGKLLKVALEVGIIMATNHRKKKKITQ